MPELTHRSVEQLLEVLSRVQHNLQRGVPLPDCYHEAVRAVSTHYGVTYQTIGDFRRRLGFRDVDAYMALIEKWLYGDATPLRDTIRRQAVPGARQTIDRFFADGSCLMSASAAPNGTHAHQSAETLATIGSTSEPRPEELKLRIPGQLAQRLTLAHMARLGPTREDTALALLEAGFQARSAEIRRFLDNTVGTT